MEGSGERVLLVTRVTTRSRLTLIGREEVGSHNHLDSIVPGYGTNGSSGTRARHIPSSITKPGFPPDSLQLDPNDDVVKLQSRDCARFRDPQMEACVPCTNIPTSHEFKSVVARFQGTFSKQPVYLLVVGAGREEIEGSEE